MKRYTLLYLVQTLIIASAVCPQALMAQQPTGQYALYNYRNDGEFNAWLNIDVDSITYSCIDTLGVEHDDVVVQEVWTRDSLYRIPLNAVDSIGFRAPAPVYKNNVFHIRDYHMPYVLKAEGLTLTLSKEIKKDSIPQVGQIIVSDIVDERLPRGFSGRVLSVESTTNAYVFTCEAVALNEIFDRLLLVGRSESFIPEEMEQVRRKSSANDSDWDGIIPFEVGKFRINIPSIEGFVSNSKSDMTLGTISVTPKFCVSFIADIKPFVHSYVKVLFENKSKVSTEMHLKVSGESSLTETKIARVYLTKVPIPLVTGVLYGEVAVSGDLSLKGNLDLKATFSKNLYNGDEYEWSTSDFWDIKHKRYDKDPNKEKKGDEDDDNQWQSDVSLSVNGSFGFGASLDLDLFAVSENTLEISNTTTVGPELSGSLEFSSEGLEDGTLYSTLKNTNVSFTPLKLSDEVKFNICMREFTLGSFSKDFGKKEFKLFPDFGALSVPSLYDYESGYYKPLGLYTKVTNDVIPIIPLRLGIGRYDNEGNLIDESFASDLYQYEDEWKKEWLTYDISSLPTNSTYTFHPLIRVWGLKALQLKAMPESKITIPKSLSLSKSTLYLKVGGGEDVTILDGWGDYEVKSPTSSVAYGNQFTTNKPDGGTEKGVSVVAVSPGTAEIQVIDKRSRESFILSVVVTDTPKSVISISPKKIDFGIVMEGSTKTGYFTVTNAGDAELVFKVVRPEAPFDIPEAGVVFSLAAGDSKVFAATCHGFGNEDGNKSVFVKIESNAANAADAVVTLTAGSASPVTSTIKVDPTEIAFGSVEFGTTITRELRVSNIGDMSLSFHVERQGSDMFTITDAGREFTLNPGDFKLFTVTCQGMMEDDNAAGELQIVTTADNGNQIVKLSAKGALPTTLTLEQNAISVTAGNIAYANILFGSKDYVLANGNNDVVTAMADFSDYDHPYGRIKIVALEEGQSVVKLTDRRTSKTVSLAVTVAEDSSPYITFADSEVERICLQNWDTNADGQLSKTEAASVTDLDGVFMYNHKIKSFTEFRYFTGVSSLEFDFKECSRLQDIILPKNLKEIGWNTFFDCGSLKSIHVPKNVSFVDGLAFQWSDNLESITVSSDNATYDARNNCNAIIETATNTLKNGCYTTVIPSSVTSIGYCAFWGQDRLKEITIPSSVTYISEGAFGGCYLKSIEIPAAVAYIGDGAFACCTNLKSISIAPGNAVYDSREGCNAIVNSFTNELVVGCQNTTIPSSVTSIGSEAFKWQRYLKRIDIPESIKSIGNEAFYGCSSLEDVFIPACVTSIGDAAFADCGDLTSLVVSAENPNYDSRDNCNAIIETESNTLLSGNEHSQLPEGIEAIGTRAFGGYQGNSITLPEGVKTIGHNAFWDSWLRSITLPSTLTSLGSDVFWECGDLTNVTCYAKNVPSSGGFDPGDMSFPVHQATLYVPAASVESYRNSMYWQDFGSIVALPQSTIKVEPVSVDFGTMSKGESKTEHFTVYNTGEGILFFHLDYDSDMFQVSDVGQEFMLGSGMSKQFTVVCAIPEDELSSGGGAAVWIRSDATNADEYSMVSLSMSVSQQTKKEISVSPTEIEFGLVEYGTDKTEKFTVTNTGTDMLTLHVPKLKGADRYFDVSEPNEEFSLASGQSKEYKVTCHGLPKGEWAEVEFKVVSNAENGTKVVKVHSLGWDESPLLEVSSMTVKVGETGSVKMQGSYGCTYEINNSNPNVVEAIKGGDHSINGSIGFDGYHGSEYSYLNITAISLGTAIVKVTDSTTGEEATLTVVVTEDSTSEIPAEAVDLGLPSGTRWASYNVGATKQEEFGGYFAWGETEEKGEYTNDTYIYRGVDIGRNISGTNYDAAHTKWGGDWCMPTQEEFEELMNNCSHSWTKINDVNGMLFTASNGNSIFLPATGRKSDSEVWDVQTNGFYRAATCHPYYLTGYSPDAGPDVFCFVEDDWARAGADDGASIRPVIHSSTIPDDSLFVYPMDLDFDLVELSTSKTKTFKVVNTKDQNVTFHISSDNQFTDYFEVANSGQEFTLAPDESMEFVVTSHGMPSGHSARTSILVISHDDNQEQKVMLKSYGWDYLFEAIPDTMAVGESVSIPIKSSDFSVECSYFIPGAWLVGDNVISAEKGGSSSGGGRTRWDDSYHLYVATNLQIDAKKEGLGRIVINDNVTGKHYEKFINVVADDTPLPAITVEPTD